jgi:hypothetical protein
MNAHKKKFIIPLLLILFLTLGALFRFYNIGKDDFWIDEIIGFWVAEPHIALNETLQRQRILENSPFLFNFSLKYFFKIFNYNVDISRYYVAFLSVISILLPWFILDGNKKNKKFLISILLISFNIFLIKYSQELRAYSFLAFLFLINLAFFVKLLMTDRGIYNFPKIFIFILINILLLLTHPFALTVLFSYIVLSVINFAKFRKNLKNLNVSLLFLVLFSILYLYFFLKNTTHLPVWIAPIELKFFTNFFFQAFFGSRIVGLVYLLILIYLISKNFKKIITENNLNLILILIIFSAYLLPVIFSIFIHPALVPRYVIFIVIPIIILIVNLAYDQENSFNKKIIFSLLIISTMGNFVTETTFKQFFFETRIHKPDYKSVFLTIKNSNIKKYSLNLEKTYLDKNNLGKAFANYSKNYSKVNNDELIFVNYLIENIDYEKISKIWIICSQNINGENCDVPKKLENFKIEKDLYFSSLNLKLLKNLK